jgi:hypothetical protein
MQQGAHDQLTCLMGREQGLSQERQKMQWDPPGFRMGSPVKLAGPALPVLTAEPFIWALASPHGQGEPGTQAPDYGQQLRDKHPSLPPPRGLLQPGTTRAQLPSSGSQGTDVT